MWAPIHIGRMPMKTIQMTIDPRLLKAIDRLTRLRKTTRSALIRTALEAELRREHIHELETRHADGYAKQPAMPGEFDTWTHEQEWGA
jgi:metal-responsive CopG/Arc/MetJ family transcriptional regulator